MQLRFVAAVPPTHRGGGVEQLVMETGPDAGSWFLFGHATLQEPCLWDSWFPTREEAMREASERWGVSAHDWR